MDFICDKCGFKGKTDAPFAGCPTCRDQSTLRLKFQPDAGLLKKHLSQACTRDDLISLYPGYDKASWVSLGEGLTPLVRSKKIGPALGMDNLYFKCEFCNPTGSFKDRYVGLTVNIGKKLGYKGVIVSSTGNLGIATAAYAAAAGMACVFISGSDAPAAYIADGLKYGAKVVSVPPSLRHQAFHALAEQSGWLPMGLFMPRAIQNPFGIEAYRNIGYEMHLDLGRFPDAVIYPVARGNNLFGTYLGFQSMAAAGLGKPLPKMFTAQPEGGNTVEQSLEQGLDASVLIEKAPSIASSANETETSDYTLSAVRDTSGWGASATDEEIMDAVDRLAAEGLLVEPASALVVAILPKLIAAGRLKPSDHCVAVLTGAGSRWISADPKPHITVDESTEISQDWAEKFWPLVEKL